MLSIYDWFGYEIPIEERYSMIKGAGFDGVLLWWSDCFGRDTLGKGDYRKGPERARRAGLVVENIHAPVHIQNDLWQDSLDGESAIDCYLQCVTDCAGFEIPTMVVHLPDEQHPHTPLGLDRVKRLAERAEALCVNIAMENLCNLPNLAYVLEQVDSPRVGYCYDCAHHYRYYPAHDFLAAYGPRLMALHLHDNDGPAMHRLPFDGTVDWPAAMEGIAQTGYTGATAIEAMNWDYTHLTAEGFLQEAFQRAEKLEALRGCKNHGGHVIP